MAGFLCVDIDACIVAFTYFYIFASVVLLPVVRHIWSRKALSYVIPVGMIGLGALLVTYLNLSSDGGEADAGKQVLSTIVTNTALIIWSAALGVLVLRTDGSDSSGESETDTDRRSPTAPPSDGKIERQVSFSQLLARLRGARTASSSIFGRCKALLPLLVLLLAVLLLIALPEEVRRESVWLRSAALITILACYLYGLWLLVLPLRTLADPVPELMRELDRRFAQEGSLRVHLQDVSVEQRRLMSARLERYMRRLSGASKVSQLAFVLSPLFAFLLELFSQDGLGSLGSGPLLIGGAVLLGALIGIMQLRRALVELESLQFSLAEMPAGDGNQRS